MIDQYSREAILRLRSQGKTYTEISSELGRAFPKSTLSYICKDVKLPKNYYLHQKRRLLDHLVQAREKATRANEAKLRRRFQSIYEEARRVTNSQSDIDRKKVILAMLYLGEGSKYKSYRGLSLGSSDAEILKTYIALLKLCYGKKRENFRARIQHRSDQDESYLMRYWSDILGMSESMFYPSYADKRTISKSSKNLEYKGVCVISCSGADIQLELDAIARLFGQKIWGVSSSG